MRPWAVAAPTCHRATLFHGGRQMVRDSATRTEKLLTWLGMWGAMRGFLPLTAAVIGSVALLEFLTPPAARLFPSVFTGLLHVLAVGIGLLLGLIGHFAGDFWDRVIFEACYGPQGMWLDLTRRPLLVFPAGSALKAERSRASQALSRHPDAREGV